LKLKKFIKELILTLIFVAVVANVISYIRKPKLDFKTFPPLHATLIDGSKFDYDKLQKKPLILHFWATWCPTCKLEIYNFQRLKEDGYEVLSVAVSSGSDEEIRKFMDKKGLNFKVINDKDGKLAEYFKVKGFPTTFVFDKDHKLFFSDVGYTSDLSIKIKIWLSDLL